MVKRFRIAQVFFGLPALRYIFDGSFIIKQVAIGVAHGPAILGNPDHRAIFPIDLRLEPGDGVMLLHEADKLSAPSLLRVQAAADIRETRHQLLGGVVTVNSGQRCIGHEIMSLGGGLKNPFNEVVKDAVISCFGSQQGPVHPMPFNGVSNRTLQPARIELVFHEIIVCPGMNGFQRNGFIIGFAGHNDWKLRSFSFD